MPTLDGRGGMMSRLRGASVTIGSACSLAHYSPQPHWQCLDEARPTRGYLTACTASAPAICKSYYIYTYIYIYIDIYIYVNECIYIHIHVNEATCCFKWSLLNVKDSPCNS